MISPVEYLRINGIPCVTVGMISQRHTDNEVANFQDWHNGQTGIVAEDGTLGIYADDYERWLRQGMQSKQSKKDWD